MFPQPYFPTTYFPGTYFPPDVSAILQEFFIKASLKFAPQINAPAKFVPKIIADAYFLALQKAGFRFNPNIVKDLRFMEDLVENLRFGPDLEANVRFCSAEFPTEFGIVNGAITGQNDDSWNDYFGRIDIPVSTMSSLPVFEKVTWVVWWYWDGTSLKFENVQSGLWSCGFQNPVLGTAGNRPWAFYFQFDSGQNRDELNLQFTSIGSLTFNNTLHGDMLGRPAPGAPYLNKWNCMLYSVDNSAASGINRKAMLYFNDDQQNVWLHADMFGSPGQRIWNFPTVQADNISSWVGHALAGFSPPPGIIGAISQHFAFAMCWVSWGTYLDFTVEANRRKFVLADGCPADLGSSGDNPGGTPHLWYMGDAANVNINRGSLGSAFDLPVWSGTPVSFVPAPDFGC